MPVTDHPAETDSKNAYDDSNPLSAANALGYAWSASSGNSAYDYTDPSLFDLGYLPNKEEFGQPVSNGPSKFFDNDPNGIPYLFTPTESVVQSYAAPLHNDSASMGVGTQGSGFSAVPETWASRAYQNAVNNADHADIEDNAGLMKALPHLYEKMGNFWAALTATDNGVTEQGVNPFTQRSMMGNEVRDERINVAGTVALAWLQALEAPKVAIGNTVNRGSTEAVEQTIESHIVLGPDEMEGEVPPVPTSVYIPRDENGNVIPLDMRQVPGVGDVPLPLPLAEGPHTVLGGKVGADGITEYRQSATFPGGTWPPADGNEVPWGRVDWTSHPYLPGDPHPDPHIHVFYFDSEQGQWRSSGATPFYGH